jgi:hypothetical protein
MGEFLEPKGEVETLPPSGDGLLIQVKEDTVKKKSRAAAYAAAPPPLRLRQPSL